MADNRPLIERLRNPLGPPSYLVMQEAADWIEEANRLMDQCKDVLSDELARIRKEEEAE